MRRRAAARPVRRRRRRTARITIVARVPAGVAPGTYPNVATAAAPSAPPTTSPPAPVDRRGPRQRVGRQVVPRRARTRRSHRERRRPIASASSTTARRSPPTSSSPTSSHGVPAGHVHADRVAGRLGDAARPDTGVRPGAVDVRPRRPAAGHDRRAGARRRRRRQLASIPMSAVDEHGRRRPRRPTIRTPATTPARSPSRLTPQADLSIRKIAAPESPIAGDRRDESLASRSFRIEIVNFGPSAGPACTFTDTLPPGMTFVRIYDFDDPDLDLTPFLNCTVTGEPATGQTVSCAPAARSASRPSSASSSGSRSRSTRRSRTAPCWRTASRSSPTCRTATPATTRPPPSSRCARGQRAGGEAGRRGGRQWTP